MDECELFISSLVKYLNWFGDSAVRMSLILDLKRISKSWAIAVNLLIVSALVVSINGCVSSLEQMWLLETLTCFSYIILAFSWVQNLFTDDKGVATFKGIPFMTSAGPCTSSIPKASIKWWKLLLGPKTKKPKAPAPLMGFCFGFEPYLSMLQSTNVFCVSSFVPGESVTLQKWIFLRILSWAVRITNV